jgi:excisionase family DNA binding protein
MPSGSSDTQNRPQQPNMDDFFERLRDAVTPKALPAPAEGASGISVPITDKLYLTLREASELSGLPVGYIRAAMKDGKLKGIKTGAGWRLKRADLSTAFD